MAKHYQTQRILLALAGIQEAARHAEAVVKECPQAAPLLLSVVRENVQRYSWLVQDETPSREGSKPPNTETVAP